MKKTFDYVIIGAGMAGLSLAHEIKNKSILIIEKDSVVGGLSKTLKYKNFKFDYCAHRFHSDNPEVMNKVKNIMKDNFFLHRQKSRIYMFGKFLKYPFELQNFLRAIPKHKAILATISFLFSIIKRIFQKKISFLNYEDWFSYHFGYFLYKIMSKEYTSKIWKNDPKNISADWAQQRFQQIKLFKLVRVIIKKIFTLNFSSFSLTDEKLAPDGGPFWYPKNGIQDIPDTYYKLLKSKKTEVYLNAKLEKVDLKNKKIMFSNKNILDFVFFKKSLISTIPLYSLNDALTDKNKKITKEINKLKYMDIIFVYIMIKRKQVSKDHWLYFPDKNIIFNRAVEFKNWSKEMSPDNLTSLCFDISCYRNNNSENNPWYFSKEKLINKCVNDSIKVGLFKKEDVFDSLVIKVKDAYPFYDLDYKKKLTSIINFFEKKKKIHCLGRTGTFSYNNSDGSIEMGINLAKKLNKKDVN